jgi:hypothetical protein
MRRRRLDPDIELTLLAIAIVGLVYGCMARCLRAAWAEEQQPTIGTATAEVHVAAPAAAQPLPPPPPPTTRTVTGDHGDRITYRPAPKRPADLRLNLTSYQPCACDNRPWCDSGTGGGDSDCRGYPLHWGCLASNGSWAYGTRVYLGAPLWQTFVVVDRFGGWQSHDRADLCCYWPSQFRYWDAQCPMNVQAWVLRKGE